MDIKKVEQPSSGAAKLAHGTRCEFMVRQYLADDHKKKCERFAVYNIDGENFCRQHAGNVCLSYAAKEGGIE